MDICGVDFSVFHKVIHSGIIKTKNVVLIWWQKKIGKLE